jgi:tetratricopeptide (TPR) repeat protein
VALVEAITGQAKLISDIHQSLVSTERPALRLRGPSGSGKTWVANRIVQEWRRSDRVAFVAPGDEMLSRRPHFPLLLAVASETDREQFKARTKLALEPVTAIPVGGKALREMLFQLFDRKDSEIAAQTPYLSQEDREILLRMQKAAAGEPSLLICDNFQWWDVASVEFLKLALSPATRAVFPFLGTLAILVVQTDDSPEQLPIQAETLFASFSWQSFSLPLSSAATFPELLRSFGVRSAIPPDVVKQLYGITGGHLDLVRRIADADMYASFHGQETKPGLLSELLERRLALYAALPDDTASVLRAAAIIGNSFADYELECLLKGREEIARMLEPAERLRIVERSGTTRSFVHDLVRRYYLDHAKTDREVLHQRFANCLRLFHCGDYARRAEHLRRSGDRRAAGEVLLLECLRAIRCGTLPMLETLRDDLDDDLLLFTTRMLRANAAFEAGRYGEAVEDLNAIEDLYSDGLMAERDILLARCHIKLLSRADREKARSLLSRWDALKESETEIWARATLYLVVACVFLCDEKGAQDSERILYRTLAARVAYDPTARRTLNHVRLKSNMLHSIHVARERLSRAIEFFEGAGQMAAYDPVHQCIGLINLAANHIVEGEFEEACAHCQRAHELIQSEASVTFTRPDILASNLTLALYLCGRLTATEALEAGQATWRASAANNDAPLLASNVAYYLARLNRHGDGIKILDPIFKELMNRPQFDSYYTYFIGNNLAGCLFMSGQPQEAQSIWNSVTPFVSDFVGQMTPYMKRRHELQTTIFSAAEDKADWDVFIETAAPPQVGPGWKFYGRGFLAAELEFWSDE